MSGFVIRIADTKDASDISELYRSVWKDYADRFPPELLESRTPSTKGVVEWMREDTYFVTEVADGITGVVGCSFRHGTCCLTHLAIAKEQRNHGIGRALVEAVIENARLKNASKVWLDTVPFLKEAIALYKKYGFRKCGHLRKHLWGLDMELYELVFE
ncbi:MAG: GNAT family N-acetyltransferase [Candidatus Thorarchaeota archaeon]